MAKATTTKKKATASDADGESPAATKAGKEKEPRQIKLMLRVEAIEVEVRGISELICGRMSPDAMGQIIKDQTTTKEESLLERVLPPRDPEREYRESVHWLDDGRVGWPSMAFKKAIMSAYQMMSGATLARTAEFGMKLHVEEDLIPLRCSEPRKRIDRTRNPKTRMAMIKFRMGIREWEARLRITYNRAVISPEEIIQILTYAGWHVGIGERRPSKGGGLNGRFEVTRCSVA